MAVVEKSCQQCGAQLTPAMIRCRECGTRADAAPVDNKPPQAAPAPYRAQREHKQPPASHGSVNLDDMLHFAEEAGSETTDKFVVSHTPPPANLQRAQLTATASRNGSAPSQKPPGKPATASTPQPPRKRPQTARPPGAGSQAAAGSKSSSDSHDSVEIAGASRRTRERTKESLTELQLTIRKALKQPAPAPETLLAGSEQLDATALKKLHKTWKKTIKQCRKTLEDHYDEQGRAAVTALCHALEELGKVQTEESVEIIAGYLEDPRPAVRETAARELGETHLISAFEPLVKRLAHESGDMRGAAIQGLGTLGDRRAILPLVVLSSEDPQYSLRIADALVKLGEAAIPQLIEIAEGASPSHVLTAIIALGRLKDARALEILARQSTHEMSTIRSHAVEALGQMGESKGIRYLVRGLNDPHVGVRIQAAIGLKKLADKRACDALIQSLADPDDDVREHVIYALGACGDKAAGPSLIPLLESKNQELCIAAAEALGKLGDERAVPKLCELLERIDGTDHRTTLLKILDSLRRLKNPAAVPFLLKLLADPSAEIRARTVDALGQIKDPASAVDLENLLKEDKDESVRMSAARALGEIGDEESIRVLEEALNDTVQVRIKAVIALGQIGKQAAMLSLTAMLRDQLPELRYHSAQALAEIGDERSIRPIEILAADPDPMVSRGAFKALQKLGDERSEKAILKAARKRSKKATTVKSSRGSLKDLFDLTAIREMIWPPEPQKRYLILGSLAGILVVGLVALSFMFSTAGDLRFARGFPESLAMGPNGEKIAVGWSMGVLDLFNIGSQSPSVSVPIENNSLNALGYVADNNFWIAFGSQIVRYEGDKPIPIAAQKEAFTRIELSQDRKQVAIFDAAMNVFVYDAASGNSVTSMAFPKESTVEFSGTGSFFAVTAPKNQLKIFDLQSKEIASLTLESPISSFAFSSDDKLLAVCHGGMGKLTIYNLPDKTVAHEATPEKQSLAGRLKFVNNDQELMLYGVTKNPDGGIGRWKIGTPQIEFIKKSPNYLPTTISDNGERISWLIESNVKIQFYDLKTQKRSSLYYNPSQ